MKEFVIPYFQHQEEVNAYFQSQASYWKDIYIYRHGGLQGEILRDRHAAVLDWIDSLALAPGSQVLEIGCGAGFMAVALAQRGFRVRAIDSAQAMVDLAYRYAMETGTTNLLSLSVGDVHSLAFEDESFDLVLAIGVIPWLEHPERALQEVARVTRSDGYVILTTANQAGLVSLLDPMVSPVFKPLKQQLKKALTRIKPRHWSPSMTFHDCRFIDETLARVNLVKTRGMTRGFAFSLLRREVLPEPLGVALHHQLQSLADRHVPLFRSTGMAYFVLARKSVS